MTITEFCELVGIFATLATVIVKFTRLNDKVDIMWSFLVRRAQSEAVLCGIATPTDEGTFMINEKGQHLIPPMLANDLRSFYRTLDPDISDAELKLKIEGKFGDRVLREVCVPSKVFLGACLVAAVGVAKS